MFADCEHVQNEKRQESCDSSSLRRNAVFGELLGKGWRASGRSRLEVQWCLFEIGENSTPLVSDVLD